MTDISPARVHLLGFDLDALTLEETAQRAHAMAMGGAGCHQHVALNAAKIVEASSNTRLTSIIRSCDLVSADGMSVVWAARYLGVPIPERVTGIDLMHRLIELAATHDSSIFLLGARENAVQATASLLRTQHPRLRIVGVRDGYWADDAELVEMVRRAQPNYLFLAIPSPRKEYWLSRWLPELGVGFAMGVGGTFDILAGDRRRAPVWAQDAGIEWLFRFVQEPRRMWRRYLVGNARFILLVAAEKLRLWALR